MDVVQVFLLCGAVAGVVMMIVSFAGKKPSKESPVSARPEEYGGSFIDKKLTAMGTSISEADSLLSELGGVSQNVLKEIDQKYNELLFLYNLIDEKKKETMSDTPAQIANAERTALLGANREQGKTKEAPPGRRLPSALANPRFQRILDLRGQGFSVVDIAKELNMGQGEVSLIVTLSGE